MWWVWVLVGLGITVTIGGIIVIIKIVKAFDEFRS